LSVSLIVFVALELNIEDVAINVLGPYSAADQRAAPERQVPALPVHLRR